MTESWVLNSKRSHPVSASGSNCCISHFFARVILFDSCLPVHQILLFFISFLRYFCVVPFWLSYWSDLRSDTDLLLKLKTYLVNIWTRTASLLNGKWLFESLFFWKSLTAWPWQASGTPLLCELEEGGVWGCWHEDMKAHCNACHTHNAQ